MDIKSKILLILNCVSYIYMMIMGYIIGSGLYNNLDNKNKLLMGNIWLILIFITSFVLASDRFPEFKNVKKEAIFDWILRICGFGLAIEGVKYLDIKKVLIIILVMFIISIIIEIIMNKKILNESYKLKEYQDEKITQEERNGFLYMKKAVNSQPKITIMFIALSLSVTINKNMPGTTERWYIPVIVSIIMFICFIRKSFENYQGLFQDREYGKKKMRKDIGLSSLGYLICLVLAFYQMKYDLYSWVTFIGVIFTIPVFDTCHKRAIRLQQIHKSINEN